MVRHKEMNLTSSDSVQKYEMLNSLLHALYEEIKELSAKKQDLILNKLKVTTINRILRQIKELLKDQPTLEFTDLLDEETLPSNSDAVLVLAQFKSAMRQFHDRYYRREPGESSLRWHTTENPSAQQGAGGDAANRVPPFQH